MVLPKNIEITPSLEEIKKGARPKEIQITTFMDGPFGRMENTTVWKTQFKHKVKDYREDIVFSEGWFDTGVSEMPLMPWNVSYSHKFNIGKVGQAMFGVKRYGKYRLYGSRDIYYTGEMQMGRKVRTALHYVSFKVDGNEDGILLAEEKDVELWKLSMSLIEQRNVTDINVREVTPKAARGLLEEKTGASKAIDKARENSLRLKYQLYRLIVDLARGQAVKRIFQTTDSDTMEQVRRWSKKAWSAVSAEGFPKVW